MLLPRDRLAEEQYNRGGGREFGFISMMLGWEELAKEKKGKEREKNKKLWLPGRRLRVSISLFSSIAYVMKKNGRGEGRGEKKARVVDRDH